MKLIKLTVLPLLLFASLLTLNSCEKVAEKKKTTDYSKSNIVLSGAQEVPANASTALGSMDVFFSRVTRTLNYTVRWSGLTDSVFLMHIHGNAPSGFNAGVLQNIIVTAPTNGTIGNGIFPQKTAAGKFTYPKTGTLSGTLLVDGVFIKENDLLNGFYYMNIHTATYGGGEIRGQIVFQ